MLPNLITSSDMLVPSGKTGIIRYIDGNEGYVNNRNFGMTESNFQNSLQGRIGSGSEVTYTMPRYKIKGVDANGQPLAVEILEPGENIQLSANPNFGVMFLNDPNTFTILDDTVSFETIVNDDVAKINVIDEKKETNWALIGIFSGLGAAVVILVLVGLAMSRNNRNNSSSVTSLPSPIRVAST
jgi:hypothetical protein